MYTTFPVRAVGHLAPGLFSHDVAPWLRELRFKRLPDPERNPMTVLQIGYGSPALNPKTRG